MEKDYAELSLKDAFKALIEIDEEFDEKIRKQYGDKLERSSRRIPTRTLSEGIDVNTYSTKESEAAQEQLNSAGDKSDTVLRVIDVDADTLDHIKDGKNYVGQMILQCKVCRALRFIDIDKLQVSKEDEDVFNVEDECPNCYTVGKGYTVVGQVGKAPEEEAEIKNDEVNTVEGETIENDIEAEVETPEEEKPEEEEVETEETDTETFEQEEETPFDETDVADEDEDDDLPPLGEETEEDHAEDDTVEETDEEDEEEELEDKEDIEESFEEPKTKINLVPKIDSVGSLFECLVEGLDCENVSCIGKDEQLLYKGACKEMPSGLRDSKLIGFNTCGGDLIINIDLDCPGEVCLRDLLNLFTDEECENISLVDNICDSEVYCGNKKGALDHFGDYAVWSVERPKEIQCVSDYTEVVPWKEDEEEACDKDYLIRDIVKKNGLRPDRICNPKCAEFWIAESIKNGEDLDVIYEGYVKCLDEATINAFKNETGYMDEADKALQAELNETAARNDSVQDAHALAKEDLKAHNAYAVIYGYFSRGKFFALPKNIICNSDRELRFASEMVRSKYRVSGSIYTVYSGKVNETLDDLSVEDVEVERASTEDQTNLEELRAGVANWARDDYENGTVFSSDDKELFDEYCKECFETYVSSSHLDDLWDCYFGTIDELREEDNTEEEEEEVEIVDDEDDEEEVEIVDDEDDENESLNESAVLNAQSKMINDGADKIDKAITAAGIEAQVVTDSSYPTMIGIMVADEDTLAKVKPIAEKVFKEMSWEPTEVKDVKEDETIGVTYDKIKIVHTVGIEEGKEIKHYKNRKELSEAVKVLKNNNRPYIVKRSLKEGYRYTVISEALKNWDVTDLETGSNLGTVKAATELDAYNKACELYRDVCEEENILVDEVVEDAEDAEDAEAEEVEFEAEKFDENLTQYLRDISGEDVAYITEKGSMDRNGNILLEGKITCNDSAKDIKFLFEEIITPELKSKPTYKVSNNLSDEIFEFCAED